MAPRLADGVNRRTTAPPIGSPGKWIIRQYYQAVEAVSHVPRTGNRYLNQAFVSGVGIDVGAEELHAFYPVCGLLQVLSIAKAGVKPQAIAQPKIVFSPTW